MIELETEVIWENADGRNWFPVRLGKGRKKLAARLEETKGN
jgi:hypothetical protein